MLYNEKIICGEVEWETGYCYEDLKEPIKDEFCPICNRQMYSCYDECGYTIQCEDFKCFYINWFIGRPTLIVSGREYDYDTELEIYKKLSRCGKISHSNQEEYIRSLAGKPNNLIEPSDFDMCSKCGAKVEQDHFIKCSGTWTLARPICNACTKIYNDKINQ